MPNARGSGIPQVIAARQIEDPKIRFDLVSLKGAAGKIVVMTFALGCGASIGREGPTVQVGAAIMAAMGRALPAYQPGLLLAGAAAGIAAAFNTPLAGIVFGIEELSRTFEVRTSGLVIAAVIAAGVTSLGLIGDYTYFGVSSQTLPLGRAWAVVPVCAILGGVTGGLFSRIMILFSRGLPGRLGSALKAHPVVFALLCGLGVALCGYASENSVYGTGYGEARAIVHGSDSLTHLFAPLKFAATILSSVSGIPGGLFAPSLAVGAGLGADLGLLFHDTPLGALALLGMVSYLAGVVQTPITSFVIVSEMTQDHAMIIPLMIAALVATAVSKLVCPEGLYHTLARAFMPKAIKPDPARPQ